MLFRSRAAMNAWVDAERERLKREHDEWLAHKSEWLALAEAFNKNPRMSRKEFDRLYRELGL